jgi:hypothetical protein
MMSEEIGLLFYKAKASDGSNALAQMGARAMSEADARRYIDAKILTHNAEEPHSSSSAPPAYFVPLSAFIPMEASLAEPLKQEEFEIGDEDDDEDCQNPHCLRHSKAARNQLRETLENHPAKVVILRSLGVDEEEEE